MHPNSFGETPIFVGRKPSASRIDLDVRRNRTVCLRAFGVQLQTHPHPQGPAGRRRFHAANGVIRGTLMRPLDEFLGIPTEPKSNGRCLLGCPPKIAVGGPKISLGILASL